MSKALTSHLIMGPISFNRLGIGCVAHQLLLGDGIFTFIFGQNAFKGVHDLSFYFVAC
jgi:hypothetical protein